MENEKIKKYIKEIVNLVEDKDYPARRNITDYVELILGEYDPEFGKEMSKYIMELYKESDKKNGIKS